MHRGQWGPKALRTPQQRPFRHLGSCLEVLAFFSVSTYWLCAITMFHEHAGVSRSFKMYRIQGRVDLPTSSCCFICKLVGKYPMNRGKPPHPSCSFPHPHSKTPHLVQVSSDYSKRPGEFAQSLNQGRFETPICYWIDILCYLNKWILIVIDHNHLEAG